MANTEVTKFRDQSIEDLKSSLETMAIEIFRLKNEFKTTRKFEKPHLLKEMKKNRARAMTILSEKGGTI